MKFLSPFLKPARDKPSSAIDGKPVAAPAVRQLLLVTLFGVDPSGFAEILDRTSASNPDIKVVYVIDTLEFAVFRARKAAFEYMPRCRSRAGTRRH